MPDILDEYYEALDRLVKNKPKRVPKGTRISNDAVALEAGRGKGSIKRSRPIYAELISAINREKEEQTSGENKVKDQLSRARLESKKYRKLYEEGLVRELSLYYELDELKREFNKLQSK